MDIFNIHVLRSVGKVIAQLSLKQAGAMAGDKNTLSVTAKDEVTTSLINLYCYNHVRIFLLSFVENSRINS